MIQIFTYSQKHENGFKLYQQSFSNLISKETIEKFHETEDKMLADIVNVGFALALLIDSDKAAGGVRIRQLERFAYNEFTKSYETFTYPDNKMFYANEPDKQRIAAVYTNQDTWKAIHFPITDKYKKYIDRVWYLKEFHKLTIAVGVAEKMQDKGVLHYLRTAYEI